MQYTRQRIARPDWGLREAILLPWYKELADQYLASPYDSWSGNYSLFTSYEQRAEAAGEVRFSRNVDGSKWLVYRDAMKAQGMLFPEEDPKTEAAAPIDGDGNLSTENGEAPAPTVGPAKPPQAARAAGAGGTTTSTRANRATKKSSKQSARK